MKQNLLQIAICQVEEPRSRNRYGRFRPSRVRIPPSPL